MKYPGYGPDVEKNRAEAKRLLAEAGFPNGFNVTMGVRPSQEDSSVFLQDQFAIIGIIGTLKSIETNTAYGLLEKGDYEIFNWGTAYAFDDPDAIFSEHYTCNAARNYQKLCIPEVDALFDKQSQTLDPVERKKLVNEMEKAALNLMPKIILPIGHLELPAGLACAAKLLQQPPLGAGVARAIGEAREPQEKCVLPASNTHRRL